MYAKYFSIRAVLALIAMSMPVVQTASAATVTFDGDDFSSAIWDAGPFDSASSTIGDYIFEVSDFVGSVVAGTPEANGIDPDTYNYISVSRLDGQAFSVTAIDYWYSLSNMTQGISYQDADGGYYTPYYWPQAIADGDLGNILNVSVWASGGTAYVALNSITVGAAVPVPAALWLFGSALAGLGWMKRRTTP